MSIKISNFKLAIGFPNSWHYVASAFFESILQMERPDFLLLQAKNGPIDQLRNHLVEQALTLGASHLWMADTDQIYPKNTITKMLSHRLPVVHSMVHRRYPPFDNLMYKGVLNKFTSMVEGEDYNDGDLVEVDASGTGCVLYDMRVFYKIKPPWFEFAPNPSKEKGGLVGEDIWFCEKLKKAGFKIYVDTSIKIIHLCSLGIDENFSRLYQTLVKRQMALNEKKDINYYNDKNIEWEYNGKNELCDLKN